MPYKPFVNEKIVAYRRVIGDKVLKLRRDRRLTLKGTADLCGVSAAYISEVERGQVSPTLETMSKVAKGFDKPISYFLPSEYLSSSEITRMDEQEISSEDKSEVRALNRGFSGSSIAGSRISLVGGGHFAPQGDYDTEWMGIVMKGSLELTVDGERHIAKGRDSFHIGGKLLQSIRNRGQGKAELILIERKASSL